MGENRVIRITPKPGEQKVNLNLEQDFDFLEILSLKITQAETYRIFCSNYGVVVGKVTSNGGFPIKNAKLSIFIPIDDEDAKNSLVTSLYPFNSPHDMLVSGKRYNLLPRDKQINTPGDHTPVGTFPSKYDLMSNKTLKYIHEKYYKYTTTTNENGDYMFFGIPGGTHIIHMDVDLSDIGSNSVIPQDLINMGYSETLFEGPDKFRDSNDLDQLAQIVGINKTVFIRPFWGDADECEFGITRLDFDTARFVSPKAFLIGSFFTDGDTDQVDAAFIPRSCQGNDIYNNFPGGNKAGVSRVVSAKDLRTPGDVANSGAKVGGRGVIEAVRVTEFNENVEYVGKWFSRPDGTFQVALPLNKGKKSWDENEQAFVDDEDGFPTYADYRFMFYFEGQGPDDFEDDSILGIQSELVASAHGYEGNGTNFNWGDPGNIWSPLNGAYTDDYFVDKYTYKGKKEAKENRGVIFAPNPVVPGDNIDNEVENNRYTFWAAPELEWNTDIPAFNMDDQFGNNATYYRNYSRIRLSGYYTTSQIFNLIGDYDIAVSGKQPPGFDATGVNGEWWNGDGDLTYPDNTSPPDWFGKSIGTNPWIISRTEISPTNTEKRQFPTNYIFDRYYRKDPRQRGRFTDGSEEVVGNVLSKGGFVSNYYMVHKGVLAEWNATIPMPLQDQFGGCAGEPDGYNPSSGYDWNTIANVTRTGLRDTPVPQSASNSYVGDNCECSGFPNGTNGNCHHMKICGQRPNYYYGQGDGLSTYSGMNTTGCNWMSLGSASWNYISYDDCEFGVYGQSWGDTACWGYNHFNRVGTEFGGTARPLDGCKGCINFSGMQTDLSGYVGRNRAANIFNQNATPYGFSQDWSIINGGSLPENNYGYGLGNIQEPDASNQGQNRTTIAAGNNCILGNSMKGGFIAPTWGNYKFKARLNYIGAAGVWWVGAGIHYCDTTQDDCDSDGNWKYSAATTNFGYTPRAREDAGQVAWAGNGGSAGDANFTYSTNFCPDEWTTAEEINSHCLALDKNALLWENGAIMGVANGGYDSAGGWLSWNLELKEGMAVRLGMVPANDCVSGTYPTSNCTTTPCGNTGDIGICAYCHNNNNYADDWGGERIAQFFIYGFTPRPHLIIDNSRELGTHGGEGLHGGLYFPQFFIGRDESDCCSRSNKDWEAYAVTSQSEVHKARLWERYSLIFAGQYQEADGEVKFQTYTAGYGDPKGGTIINNGRYYNTRTIGGTSIVDITKNYPEFRGGPNQWATIDMNLPNSSVNTDANFSYEYTLAKFDYGRASFQNPSAIDDGTGGLEFLQNKYFALYDNLEFRTNQQYPRETLGNDYNGFFPNTSNYINSWDWTSSNWTWYGWSYPMSNTLLTTSVPGNPVESRYHIYRRDNGPNNYAYPRWLPWERGVPIKWYNDNTFWWRDVIPESHPDPASPGNSTNPWLTTPYNPDMSTSDNTVLNAYPIRKYYFFGMDKSQPTALDRLKLTIPTIE